MPLQRFLVSVGVCLLVLTSACAPGSRSVEEGGNEGGSTASLVAERLEEMSVADKVGQLFVPQAVGTTAEENAELLREYRPGGLIYFPENLSDPARIAEMSNGLQELAADSGAGVPLFLGIDQEQGMVRRLPVGTVFPNAMAIGATRDPAAAETRAGVTATELAALGINVNYAPVADVNVNPDNPVIGVRSFGAEPELVGDMVVAETAAFRNAGIVPVVKHFPGHGNTDVDSHTGLPRIEQSRERWEEVDLPPFERAVESGVGAIMTAHVVMPRLDDSGEPATLSKPVLNGVLREELGYDGVVTTDALNMDGVRTTHSDGEIAVRAVLAGTDQLLMPPDLDGAHSAVMDAVEEGRISEDRLDASVRRILTLKFERGLTEAEPVDPAAAEAVVGSEEHRERAQEVADRSITMVRGGDTLPLPDGARVRVLGAGAEEIGAALTDLGHSLVSSTAEADAVVVGTHNARGDGEQRALVEGARSADAPVIVVAQGTPYDLAALGEVSGYLATYSTEKVSRVAAARVIAGAVEPEGTLPVGIPDTEYGIGDGRD